MQEDNRISTVKESIEEKRTKQDSVSGTSPV